ncbi:acyl-CoA dehydrogenase family protein [Thalassobacillus hwangdonensis]|uniref:Acyl-CoA dehydrogenase family protein n=1 Tax=Thalassobacillus hwangdonensis TaxID=546108 RepID=A0ABW3L304_9BACI
MNFYEQDPNLAFQLKHRLPAAFFVWADRELHAFGALCAGEIDQRAVHTDREGQPKLIKYDRMGDDVSEVWLNEGYKKTVKETYDRGIVGYVHKDIPELGQKGNYLYSYAQGYLLSHAEPGFYCPVTLTMATAYLLDRYADEQLKEAYLPHVLSTGETELYEGATFLTERQGGSDVGANEVLAVKKGSEYRIYGEKYFASNAGACGVAMVLARLDGAPKGSKGLSLFLVPWKKEDGKNNHIKIRRLKDKLGVRAVPSAEVEFEGAKAFLVGEAERGFYYMMEALNLSRICNAVASIGIMRRAYLEAREYAKKRDAFGNKLIDYPMIQDSLAKMAVKQEVETSAIFDLVASFDDWNKGNQNEVKTVLNRLLIAILKKESAEQAIHFSHEAIEMHGGNGYIEDFVTPRLLRDAQVLTVWEGTANILGLEVLRLLRKYEAHKLFESEVLERLDHVPDKLQPLRKQLRVAVTSLTDDCQHILEQEESIQTFHSKKLAERMAAIFEGLIALEDAAKGDERKQKVAEIYFHQTFIHEELETDPLTLKYFDAIIYQKWDTTITD